MLWKDIIGTTQTARRGILEGPLYTSEEAYKIGLVDQVAKNDDELIKLANEQMEKSLQVCGLLTICFSDIFYLLYCN